MSDTLEIVVVGTPAPQGSKRHVGNGVMIESSKLVKPWRQDVRAAALDAIAAGGPTFHDGAVVLHVVFRLHRPKGHYRTGKHADQLRPGAPAWPAVKPDVSKLVRATEDALTEAGAWRDDAQVVWLIVQKVYADRGMVGASIKVWLAGPSHKRASMTPTPTEGATMPDTRIPTDAEHKIEMARRYAEGYRDQTSKHSGEEAAAVVKAFDDLLRFMGEI